MLYFLLNIYTLKVYLYLHIKYTIQHLNYALLKLLLNINPKKSYK